MQIYVEMVKAGMIDVIVATGASIVDMDFFEALGFRHWQGTPHVDDKKLRELYIDRIYDTYIDEEELQHCDGTVKKIDGRITNEIGAFTFRLTPDVAKYRVTAKPNSGEPVSKDIEIDGAAVYRIALSLKPGGK